ncbi:MAG: hypothetical protein ACT4PV_12245 [Planctomycetaceae bacterium]
MDPREQAPTRETPTELLAWEATCMKSLAALAEGVEAARSQWMALLARTTEAEALLEATVRERDDAAGAAAQLREARKDADGLREERDLLEAGRADLEAMCAELLDARRRLEALQSEAEGLAEARLRELEASRAEFASARPQLEALAAERAALAARRDALLAERKGTLAELEARASECGRLEAELEKVRRERDELLAAAADRERSGEGLRREKDSAQASLVRMQERLKILEEEAEQSLLVICDLRYQVNQLEKGRAAAQDLAAAKVKKILTKIHAELDAVRAPNGAEMSFGERIRLLARGAANAPLDDRALESFLEEDPGFEQHAPT